MGSRRTQIPQARPMEGVSLPVFLESPGNRGRCENSREEAPRTAGVRVGNRKAFVSLRDTPHMGPLTRAAAPHFPPNHTIVFPRLRTRGISGTRGRHRWVLVEPQAGGVLAEIRKGSLVSPLSRLDAVLQVRGPTAWSQPLPPPRGPSPVTLGVRPSAWSGPVSRPCGGDPDTQPFARRSYLVVKALKAI